MIWCEIYVMPVGLVRTMFLQSNAEKLGIRSYYASCKLRILKEG